MDLSIIIVSFNTQKLLVKTIESLHAALSGDKNISYEIIVVDNGSTDGSQRSVGKLRAEISNLTLIETGENTGFAKANNTGVRNASGAYVLFLNSDTVVTSLKVSQLIDYMEKNPTVGALTVKLVLPDGHIDPACHRGFPTVWRSFAYLSGLEKLTSPLPFVNRIFGGYHLTHLPRDTAHEVDAISGAFFLMKKKLFETLGGFDEEFFMYGEDVDLAFRVKKAGYKVMYYPSQTVIHIKGQSGMKHMNEVKKQHTSAHFYNAMKIFYRKNYNSVYPTAVTKLVLWAIDKKAARSAAGHS